MGAREFKGEANLKRWGLSFARNVETDHELRVSGGSEFQSLGAMIEKALLPRDVRIYGMDRTDESDDLYTWFGHHAGTGEAVHVSK